MKVTYYGHSCFLIETAGKSFIVDPFISPNPLAANVDIDSIKCDFILLTHGHGDHVADVERIVGNTGAHIVANYEVATFYGSKDLEATGMNHGGHWYFDGGRIKYVHAVHTSSMPDGSNGGNPGGFVIESEEGNLYISGDTALTMDMKLIPMTCKPLDAAILCLGDLFTMGVDDAVIASDFVACNRIIGSHYDTFDPIKIDREEAKEKFANKNKELHLLPIGGSMEI